MYDLGMRAAARKGRKPSDLRVAVPMADH